MRVVVVGAGAFGGWTALELALRGARVTLIDAWGPGHARSSSGGETRIIRATYGGHGVYTQMAMRALERWRDLERRHGAGLLRESGVLWMFAGDDRFASDSARTLTAHGVPFHEIGVADAARRYPQIALDDVRRVWVEPEAGYLFASRACDLVARLAIAAGATSCAAAAAGPARVSGEGLRLTDGTTLAADAFVFACGPWLGELFPDQIGARIRPTRQEVLYFGTPFGDTRFSDPALPVWLDCADRVVYGIPGGAVRGFKLADDAPGPDMDPTRDDRVVATGAVAAARAFLARRFPALAQAPLVASEVCQYESTPDSHFIIDRHPGDDRIWLAGGGSGHGFKMGPVVGEIVAAAVLGHAAPDPSFALRRLETPPSGGWPAKW
jgi:sarcosine oxidase